MASNKPQQNPSSNPFRVVWGPQRFYLSIGWKTLIAFALVDFIPMLGLMALTERTLRHAMEDETLRGMEANEGNEVFYPAQLTFFISSSHTSPLPVSD